VVLSIDEAWLAWRGMDGLSKARLGAVRQGEVGIIKVIWHGMVQCGSARRGRVWQGKVELSND